MSLSLTNKLIILRSENRLTQDNVAKRLGISKSSYSRKESGKTEFTVNELNKLLELFNIKFEDLVNIDLPIRRIEKIPQELLDNLQDAINASVPETDNWNENKERYWRIQNATNDVINKKLEFADFPDLDLTTIPILTDLAEIVFDPKSEMLLSQANKIMSNLAIKLFGESTQ